MCRASIKKQKGGYFKNINSQFKLAAEMSSYIPDEDQFFENFDPQSLQERYAY